MTNYPTWYDERNNVLIVYIPFPSDIDEFTTPNCDGSYTIFISSRISPARQLAAYRHGLEHIRRNHFEEGVDVQASEKAAHNMK